MISIMFTLAIQDALVRTETRSTGAVTDIRRAYVEGRDTEVIVACDRLLLAKRSADPTVTAEVHFWRGASLRRSRRFEEALVSLDAARDLGHRAPELHLERALSLAGLGREQEAQDEMETARRLLQEDPTALDAFERRWRSRGDEPHRFELHVRPSLGYDTNIVAVDDDVLVVGDPNRESVTYGLGLAARYMLVDQPGARIAAEVAPFMRAYASEPELSYVDGTFSVGGVFAMTDAIDFVPRAAFAEAWLSEDGHLRTQRTFGLAAVARPSAMWTARLWGEFGDTDYYFDSPQPEDRDGTHQHAGIAIGTRAGGWTIGSSFTAMWFDAEGAEYDRTEYQPMLSVTPPSFGGVDLTLSVTYVLADYDAPSSLTDFEEERRDNRWLGALTIRLVALESTLGVAPSITIRFEDWGSNVGAYDFNRWIPEVDFSFLAWTF
jgi:hypothetical protein